MKLELTESASKRLQEPELKEATTLCTSPVSVGDEATREQTCLAASQNSVMSADEFALKKSNDELLEALQEIMIYVEDDYMPECSTHGYKYAVEQARALIAKHGKVGG